MAILLQSMMCRFPLLSLMKFSGFKSPCVSACSYVVVHARSASCFNFSSVIRMSFFSQISSFLASHAHSLFSSLVSSVALNTLNNQSSNHISNRSTGSDGNVGHCTLWWSEAVKLATCFHSSSLNPFWSGTIPSTKSNTATAYSPKLVWNSPCRVVRGWTTNSRPHCVCSLLAASYLIFNSEWCSYILTK